MDAMLNTPFSSFTEASQATLAFLHERFGFNLWMVTRTEGDNWIVLDSEDHGYGVQRGNVFRWADSFCSQMVQGNGPCIAPKSDDVPAYKAAPIGNQVKIGAYVGVPLCDADGELFGTLCGIDPNPVSDELANELPLIQLLGRLLSSYLVSELKLSASARIRQAEELSSSFVDVATNTLTRPGWDRIIEAEESRCAMYGNPAFVIVAELSETTTAKSAVAAIREQVSGDVSIALVENQILLLAPECDAATGTTLLDRIRESLSTKGVSACCFGVPRIPGKGLVIAVNEAIDQCSQ